jgi:hypothetical protein
MTPIVRLYVADHAHYLRYGNLQPGELVMFLPSGKTLELTKEPHQRTDGWWTLTGHIRTAANQRHDAVLPDNTIDDTRKPIGATQARALLRQGYKVSELAQWYRLT